MIALILFRFTRRLLPKAGVILFLFGTPLLSRGEHVRIETAPARAFDIPAGNASATLKAFSAQSGEQVLYPSEIVEGLKTQAVKGFLSAREAIDRMLAGTNVRAVHDEKTGAFALKRASTGEPSGSTAPRPKRRATAPREARTR